MDPDTERRIRERAYDIWLREGRPHGRHAEHWETAKAEIDAEEREKAAAAEPKRAARPAEAHPEETAKEPAAAPMRSRRAAPRGKAGAKGGARSADGNASPDGRRDR